MNTINPVRPYVSLSNNPQPTTEQTTQSLAFKGALGEKVVKELANKKALTATGIVAMASGLIGLSKDKVNDIVDSLVDRIYVLQHKNDALVKDLEETRVNASQKGTKMRAELNDNKRSLRDSFSATLQQKNAEIKEKDAEIKEKDAKIAELQKYEGMAKVKSVDELDIVSPEQFIELLKEAKVAEQKAEQSLLNYLFNGNGQEEFLAQMERSNKILKAKENGITQIPEIKEAFKGLKMAIGFHPVYVAQQMMKNVLINDLKGTYVNYPPIKKQIIENANAIINPMKTERKYPDLSNEEVLNTVSEFHEKLASQKEKLMKERNLRFEQRNVNSKNKPYYSFVNNKNEKYDIYLEDLVRGDFGFGRWTYADGSVDSWTKNGYWE